MCVCDSILRSCQAMAVPLPHSLRVFFHVDASALERKMQTSANTSTTTGLSASHRTPNRVHEIYLLKVDFTTAVRSQALTSCNIVVHFKKLLLSLNHPGFIPTLRYRECLTLPLNSPLNNVGNITRKIHLETQNDQDTKLTALCSIKR